MIKMMNLFPDSIILSQSLRDISTVHLKLRRRSLKEDMAFILLFKGNGTNNRLQKDLAFTCLGCRFWDVGQVNFIIVEVFEAELMGFLRWVVMLLVSTFDFEASAVKTIEDCF